MRRKRPADDLLPPMELAIMHILWDLGPSNVQTVQSNLEGNLAYTTVQTVLNTMEKKGRTRRQLEGKAYTYHPCLSREVTLSQAARDFISRTFQGSVEGLLMSLVKTDQLNARALSQMQAMLSREE